jgi:hypothetical protein
VCGEWLLESYWSVDECVGPLEAGDEGVLEPLVRRSYELMKCCSMDCADTAIPGFIDEHGFRFEGRGHDLEPVTPCAKCGVPVLPTLNL